MCSWPEPHRHLQRVSHERASETRNEPVFSLLVQIKDASVIAGGRIRDVDAIRLEILRPRRRGDVERVVRPQKERAVTPKVRDASPRAAAAVLSGRYRAIPCCGLKRAVPALGPRAAIAAQAGH